MTPEQILACLARVLGQAQREHYFDHGYVSDADGQWTGMLSEADTASLDAQRVRYLMGVARSITVHNARTLHHSPSSTSPHPRPLLLNCYTSAA